MTDRILYHLASDAEWEAAQAAGEIRPESLATEGFVHCSWDHQVAATAGRHFPGQADLLLLRLDPDALGAPVIEEDSYGSGTAYPHVYASIPASAIVATSTYPCRPDGGFDRPPPVTG
ncbi:MAG TPA: DUF952 domain-containing protein [Acidimicrobiales bacterium]